MPRQILFERIAHIIAVLACLYFALGVRDTPVRAPRPPSPTPVVAPSPFERDATLEVLVLAQTETRTERAASSTMAGTVGMDGGAGDPTSPILTANSSAANAPPAAGSSAEPAPAKRPVVNALVKVFYQFQGKYHWVGTSRSNAEGRTRIAALPRGSLWITAEGEGLARSSSQVVMDEKERKKELVLVPAHRLAVTVLDEQSNPIDQATVLVSTTDPLPYGALTDKSGQATVGRLGPPVYTVKVSARGFESATLRSITAPVTVKLRRLGALLIAVEDSNHQPVPGATVMLSGTSLWPARRVTTNDKGQANVHGLLAGTFDLRATKGTLVSHTEQGVPLARGEQRSLSLRLLQGRNVTVLVTDGEGEPLVPVANADVVMTEGGLSSFPERARTHADGKVTLGPFEPGPLSASAAARDFVGTSVVPVPDDAAGIVRIALRRGGTIVGRVVDQFDHAIDGASIEMVGTDFYGLPIAETPRYRELQSAGFARSLAGPEAIMAIGELGVTQGPVPPIPGAAANSEYVLASDDLLRRRAITVTDPNESEQWVSRYDGSFRAHPVTPGRLRALVRHPAYVEGQSDLVTLSPGATAEVKVVLHAGGAIEGVVVDRYGRTVGGVRIELSTATGSRVQTTYTADDGAFAFASLPSEVTLTLARAESPDRPIVRQHVTVREGKREPVRIVLPEAREAVEVLVVDEHDQPLEGVEVVVASLEPESPLRQTRFTGGDGRVSVEDARELSLSITVDNPGYAPTVERVAKAPPQLKLVMRRGVLVTGRITSIRGRVPVNRARVTVVSGGRRRIATTNAEGSWQLADVPEGPLHLVVEADGFPVVELERSAIRQARVDRGFDLGEIDLPEAGGISGIVVDQHGNPVIGAQVSTTPIAGYAPAVASPKSTGITDKSGSFHLTRVAIGKVTIYAYAPSVGRGTSAPVEVRGGRDSEDVRVTLDHPSNDEAPAISAANVAIGLSQAGSTIVIEHVATASEAERAGIRSGDQLLAIDGIKPRDLNDARTRLAGSENSDLLLDLERQGRTFRVRTVREVVRR